DGDQSIVSKTGGAGGPNGYEFYLSNNSLSGVFNSPGKPRLSSLIQCPLPITIGAWHHVAWTYDNSAMKLYFDGAPVATNVIGPKVIATSSSRLRISGDDSSGGLHYHAGFNGMIDEPSVYNRALTAAEIAAIYQA